MSDPDIDAFRRSLELARAALYARDPKRKAMEAVERLAAKHEWVPSRPTDASPRDPGASGKR